ncbi:N-acetyltransferase family protein [Alkalihalobacillus sp. 1P02AB]|uniref:GNAT family N-acetyltransferase n=1 Tax=Alkalihalobacillus sp. 1P02AB TaxID=3132260 RepID=UPI0039A705D5
MKIRHSKSEDYNKISSVMNGWWGGREMAYLLPKLFFDHFNDTSFVIEKDQKIVGFLIGFLSQSKPNEAYIHFVGVHPEYRQDGVGTRLYSSFFDNVQKRGIEIVTAISPVNKTSIAFHTRMGFQMVTGDKEVDGVPAFSDYDGNGNDRVVFIRNLSK